MNLKDDRNILKEFLAFLGEKLKTKSAGVLEKDFYITLFLNELNKKNFVFKGGTCLSKAYLNYHRFSEDLDFSWRNQKIFNNKSAKKIRKICSNLISEVGRDIERVCKKYGFEFVFDKANRNYIEIGSSNKIVTFKIWYNSVFDGRTFTKIQINFLEEFEFPIKKRRLHCLVGRDIFPESEKKYFQELIEPYTKAQVYYVYDIREIICEKIRAILTRRAVKTRDVADLYFLRKKIDFKKLEGKCIKKILFALKKYRRYRENFEKKEKLTAEDFLGENIEHLLLVDVDKKRFEKFVDEFLLVAQRIRETLSASIKS